ncbi:NAD(P)-binding protein [Byssothecium circinans]|uniref:NAD(P)-binding protein n=1 Tax=Byssothecium circinans TaxID=147558 RepID=A0A6A5UAF0_9PLEO|nr:NAD(P)-binding protein [Byssothecium circinans]
MSSTTTTTEPETQTVLYQSTYAQPLEIKTLPIPGAVHGSAVIKVLCSSVVSYSKDVFNGKRQYPYSAPLVPGTSGIGRIHALGPDSTALKVGQLVYFDPTVRSRDNPDEDAFLVGFMGGFTAGSQRLHREVWRDGSWAEYCRVPLEVVFALDEGTLIGEGGLGYKDSDLASLVGYLVPYGGLRSINLQAGETVVVAPATGGFGGSAVAVAVAMGARVVALGRNERSLEALTREFGARVKAVKIADSVEEDIVAIKQAAGGSVDAVLEILPAEAAKSTVIKSCIGALRTKGRISIMGGIMEDVSIPITQVVGKELTLQGKFMYDRDRISALIKMVEAGVLKIGQLGGVKLVGDFEFKDWEKALNVSSENAQWNAFVVMRPGAK